MFGFPWHLFISPASLETLPEASVTSLPPLFPSLVPRTETLAGSQDFVIGQGLATYETGSPVSRLTCVLGIWERWEALDRPEMDRKLECRKLGLERQSKVLPEAMFEEAGCQELGREQAA